jgi:hypothetical protein
MARKQSREIACVCPWVDRVDGFQIAHPMLRLSPQRASSISPREPNAEPAISRGTIMDELNGRMLACQILITGLIARVANESRDPLRFLTDFRDEIRAVVKGVNIAGMDNTDRVRQIAQSTVDELFSLMKPPSED